MRLTMLGPGRKWHSAKVSLNSSAVIQRCCSTMPRRANTSTPPKPASDILANATNSAIRPGGGRCRDFRRRNGGRRRIRGHGRDLERRPAQGQPIFGGIPPLHRASGVPGPDTAFAQALFFSTFAPYIEGAGSPAMEINCRRNKPFGPGGSTRRLHPSPPPERGLRRGRNRIDEGVKGVFFLGMVPPLSGYAIVANDNYAPVAQAA